MSILQKFITIPLTIASLLVAWIAYSEYQTWRYGKTIPTDEQTYTASTRECMWAEAAEGSASENDQVLIITAMLRVSKKRNIDPCWLFTRYTLMRAPSQEDLQALIRDPTFINLKSFFSAATSRNALAKIVVDRMLKGDSHFVPGEPPDVELGRRRILECVEKYIRVWPVNTARTDEGAMEKEMGQEFKSPSRTRFFCPKKE